MHRQSRTQRALTWMLAAVAWAFAVTYAIDSATAAYPQTKPIKGTLCAAKYKGRVATTKLGVRVRCTPVTRYQWKVVPK